MGLEFRDTGIEARFEAYVDGLGSVLGHADRLAPFGGYVTGLLLPLERKSVEPMAARLAPGRTGAVHQSLLHFVGVSPWSDEAVLEAVRNHVLPALGDVEAWIVDDTSMPKKGRHSVGVARQYCGQLGKRDNCQVAVSLSVANERASLPIAWRLYLPKSWATNPELRRQAGVPDDVVFQTKPAIALGQLRDAVAGELPRGVVLADAGYGNDSGFRSAVTALGLAYAVGIQGSTTVWAPGTAPLPAKPWSGRGRPPSRLRRGGEQAPVSVKTLAMGLPEEAWEDVTWRQGSQGSQGSEAPLRSRFARLRVRPAHRDEGRAEPWPEEWLLVEWPEGEKEPVKYWLSTLAADIDLDEMVRITKLRWRIEQDYRELKQEVGLSHYEGRGWRGFHHHATLCIAAYGFLVAERLLFPPAGQATGAWIKEPALPKGFRPRGAPDPKSKARAVLHPDIAHPDRRPPRQENAKMPLLPENDVGSAPDNGTFVTQ
jgi:SRSO17 transposase